MSYNRWGGDHGIIGELKIELAVAYTQKDGCAQYLNTLLQVNTDSQDKGASSRSVSISLD